jgi:TolB-like protein/Flp pilus assembly protein TadD
MGELSPGRLPPEKPSAERLDSWKEIAAYLNRDVTTVQRWEKREGMPVHRHVHDKRGSVYALTPELDAWLQSRRPRLDEEEREAAAQTPVDTEGDHRRPAIPPARLWLALAGVAMLAVLAVAYIMSRGRADNAARPKIKSLAVLPLKNLSGDPTQDYLADGMTEALIGRLANIHDLRVISHTSVMRFKNPQISVPEIARTLNVDAIVEGSVIREGNGIRVTAQLIRGATDEHFWSETYDRELRDVLALQSDVAQSIADKVQVTVTGEEHERLTAARPVAPEVYESYLQGWYELSKSDNKTDMEKSIAYFQNAINTDPTFAPAYVGLATGYTELGSNFVGDPPDAATQKAIAAARKALELDSNLSDAHELLAAMEEENWQWADSAAEHRRALELNPNDADAYEGLAWWLLYRGRTDEALEWAERGRQLDPLSVDATQMGWILFEARRYDDSIHELQSVLEVRPDDPVALWDLGIALVDEGQPQDAIPVLEKAVPLSNRSPGVIGTLIRAYAQARRRNDAIRLLGELQAREKAGFVPASAFVNAYLGLGENDQAFTWLEQCYKEHSNILRFLKVDPVFDPIRSDPRFADLARRVGLG